MQTLEFARWRTLPLGIAFSLLLHLVLGGALIFRTATSPRPAPPQESVAVEILTSQQFAALAEPNVGEGIAAGRGTPAAAVQARPQAEVKTTAPPAMVRATAMLSERNLADPRSREARVVLEQMADADRMEQLCDIEALNQVHEWQADFQPDRLVAFAMSETSLSGDTIVADGAAFRSRENWYRLKFRCGLTADHRKVASFEFQVGDAVPRNEWEERNLPAVH